MPIKTKRTRAAVEQPGETAPRTGRMPHEEARIRKKINKNKKNDEKELSKRVNAQHGRIGIFLKYFVNGGEKQT